MIRIHPQRGRGKPLTPTKNNTTTTITPPQIPFPATSTTILNSSLSSQKLSQFKFRPQTSSSTHRRTCLLPDSDPDDSELLPDVEELFADPPSGPISSSTSSRRPLLSKRLRDNNSNNSNSNHNTLNSRNSSPHEGNNKSRTPSTTTPPTTGIGDMIAKRARRTSSLGGSTSASASTTNTTTTAIAPGLISSAAAGSQDHSHRIHNFGADDDIDFDLDEFTTNDDLFFQDQQRGREEKIVSSSTNLAPVVRSERLSVIDNNNVSGSGVTTTTTTTTTSTAMGMMERSDSVMFADAFRDLDSVLGFHDEDYGDIGGGGGGGSSSGGGRRPQGPRDRFLPSGTVVVGSEKVYEPLKKTHYLPRKLEELQGFAAADGDGGDGDIDLEQQQTQQTPITTRVGGEDGLGSQSGGRLSDDNGNSLNLPFETPLAHPTECHHRLDTIDEDNGDQHQHHQQQQQHDGTYASDGGGGCGTGSAPVQNSEETRVPPAYTFTVPETIDELDHRLQTILQKFGSSLKRVTESVKGVEDLRLSLKAKTDAHFRILDQRDARIHAKKEELQSAATTIHTKAAVDLA
ncbi:hypothetical protein BG004_007331 [Podila humilis]|nr:hypothetical protein BG004_007331 [Podila humilis]